MMTITSVDCVIIMTIISASLMFRFLSLLCVYFIVSPYMFKCFKLLVY